MMKETNELVFRPVSGCIDGNGDNTLKAFIDKLLHSNLYTLTGAVRTMNGRYPEDQTTPQNISNKIKRGTINFIEVARLAEVCGYKLVFRSIANDEIEDSNAVTPVVSEKRTSADNSIRDAYRPIKATQDKQQKDILKSEFSKALVSGCVSIPSVHFGDIMVAGKQAQEGADWLKTIINPEITEAQEMAAILAVREYYDAIAQATYQLSMFRLRKKD